MQTILRTSRAAVLRPYWPFLLGYAVQVIEECWVGDTGAIGVANHRRAIRRESGHGEGYGDAVIAVRIDFRAAQLARLAAFNTQAIGAFVHGGAHAAQIFGQRGNAVAFFDAKLRGVAYLNSLLGVWTERGEH